MCWPCLQITKFQLKLCKRILITGLDTFYIASQLSIYIDTAWIKFNMIPSPGGNGRIIFQTHPPISLRLYSSITSPERIKRPNPDWIERTSLIQQSILGRKELNIIWIQCIIPHTLIQIFSTELSIFELGFHPRQDPHYYL